MDAYKLKVRIGPHEFDAEGPQDAVERQFQAWGELIGKEPTIGPPPNSENPPKENLIGSGREMTSEETHLIKVFRIEGDNVSLVLLPRTDDREGDASLMILLGHQLYTQTGAVSGEQMIEDLRQSSIQVDRADRILNRYAESSEPLVLKSGIRRGVKYRLTNQGMARAKSMAQQLAELVP